MQTMAVVNAAKSSPTTKGGQSVKRADVLEGTPFSGLLDQIRFMQDSNQPNENDDDRKAEAVFTLQFLCFFGLYPEQQCTDFEATEGSPGTTNDNAIVTEMENADMPMRNTVDEKIWPELLQFDSQKDGSAASNIQGLNSDGCGQSDANLQTEKPQEIDLQTQEYIDQSQHRNLESFAGEPENDVNRSGDGKADKPDVHIQRIGRAPRDGPRKDMDTDSGNGESTNIKQEEVKVQNPQHKNQQEAINNDFRHLVEDVITKEKTDEQPELQQTKDLEFAARVTDKVRVMLGSRKSEISIQLKPENLGKLNLKLTVEDGVLNGKMVVQNDEAKGLIQSNLAQLKENLEQQGIPVSKFQVDIGGGGEYKQQQFFQQDRRTFHGDTVKDPYGESQEEFISWRGEGTIELLA